MHSIHNNFIATMLHLNNSTFKVCILDAWTLTFHWLGLVFFLMYNCMWNKSESLIGLEIFNWFFLHIFKETKFGWTIFDYLTWLKECLIFFFFLVSSIFFPNRWTHSVFLLTHRINGIEEYLYQVFQAWAFKWHFSIEESKEKQVEPQLINRN